MDKEKLDIEKGLISAIIEFGDMKEVISKKITKDFFHTSAKEIFEFMRKHYMEFKKPPSLEAIKRKYPDFEPIEIKEPVEYFIKELQDRKRYNMILQGMKEISSSLTIKDSEKAMKELSRLVSKINAQVQIKRDSIWNLDIEPRIERMEHRMKHFGIIGVSYDNDVMDKATGGMIPGELITVIGKEGTGKTYFELAVLAKPFLLAGEDVLFISREMEGHQIEDRMDAIMLEIPADKIRQGLFTQEEFDEYKNKLENLKNQDIGRLIISADDERGFGLTAIQAKIDEHLPNGGLVIIDGSYLLDDDEGNRNASQWERISNITRGLKRMARRTGCTIAQSSQLNRQQKRGKEVDLDNAAFSSSFAQDSDVVWALYQSDEMKEVGKMGVQALKVREGPKVKMLLNWNFQTMKDFGKLATDITDVDGDDEDVVIY